MALFLHFYLFFIILFYLTYYDLTSVVFCFTIPIVPNSKFRDSKGRFRSPNSDETLPIKKLPINILNPLVGNLLGDGSLRFTHLKDGKPKPNCNASYVMTLKNKEYIFHL
jgi:hypothetical protein